MCLTNICKWFVYSKISIYFGKGKEEMHFVQYQKDITTKAIQARKNNILIHGAFKWNEIDSNVKSAHATVAFIR